LSLGSGAELASLRIVDDRLALHTRFEAHDRLNAAGSHSSGSVVALTIIFGCFADAPPAVKTPSQRQAKSPRPVGTRDSQALTSSRKRCPRALF
jgi:hypothetical protein